ncbi:hypothetical protein NM688_g8347 [Phlebia brevispora]|uniref:Uncharacterized protein n=1 Tax=Phlebia brevispora TaxID=194682 RepID=A0ACC1RTM7_9APHY|nr:hypothetical protein NM688_g8347 [Phlebia brevispora]
MTVFLLPNITNCGNRVQQLAAQIADIQLNTSTLSDDIQAQCARAKPFLHRIAQDAGYSTLDEYVNAAMAELSKAEKGRLLNVRKGFEAYRWYGGVFDPVVEIFTTTLLYVGYGIRTRRGSVNLTSKLQIPTSDALSLTSNGWQHVAEEFQPQTSIESNTIRNLVVGVAVGAILVCTAEAFYNGARRRRQLQHEIRELCCRRFRVKKIAQKAFAVYSLFGHARAILSDYDDYAEDVKNGEVTEQYVQRKMEAKHRKAVDELKMMEDTDKLSDQKIWNDLSAIDRNAGAWTDDDPTLHQIQDWLQEHGDDPRN